MKKNIFLLSVAVFTLFISACGAADEDGIFAGSECTFEGSEICSDNGVDILVCQSSTWTLKKQCNISIGKKCRQGSDGALGCFGDGENDSSSENNGNEHSADPDDENTGTDDSEVTPDTEEPDTSSENTDDIEDGSDDSDDQSSTDTENKPDDSDTQETPDTDTDTDSTDPTTEPTTEPTTDPTTNDCTSNSDCSGATPYCSITTSECIANAVFITEYVEGSSENKAIEIYNGSKTSVNLSNFTIRQANNGKSFGSDANYIYNFPESSQLAPGATYVVCNNLAVDSLLSHCNDILSTGSTLKFSGDDGMALFEGDSPVDQIGIQGDTDPWSVAGVTSATKEHTLRRKTTVIQGTTFWDTSAGTTEENSEWIVLAQDTFDGLGTR
ncbi:lamin tail domain-containing protein [bacterium]|nr:lamin tail domain-containing protein [bacterium]MBP5590620.1 lamin tail domain-containing protein [bacterium]